MSAEADRIRDEYRRRAQAGDDRYAFTEPAQILIVQETERLAVEALRRAGGLPLAGRSVLDVGCGGGGWLARFESWGTERDRLAGVDLVAARAERAAHRLPGADVREGDATSLAWDDQSFDVVFQSMMLSSVLDGATRAAIAGEMTRVLRPGGLILWYDFFVSEPRNANTRGVGRRELRRLFPDLEPTLRRATLAPPLARALAGRARPVAVALSGLRLADTHLVGTLRKAAA